MRLVVLHDKEVVMEFDVYIVLMCSDVTVGSYLRCFRYHIQTIADRRLETDTIQFGCVPCKTIKAIDIVLPIKLIKGM